MSPFRDIRAVAFDLDGTLWLGDHAVEGGPEMVAALHAAGLGVVFLTNAPDLTGEQVAAKLEQLGYPVASGSVYTAAAATARWAADECLAKVALIGDAGLRDEFERVGLDVVPVVLGGRLPRSTLWEGVEALIVGLVADLDYDDPPDPPASLCSRVRSRKALLVACNRDMTFAAEGGAVRPGCGRLLAVIENHCGRSADVVAGKPEPLMLNQAAADLGLQPQQVVVVGDSIASDVALARRAGAPWAYVPAPGHETDIPALADGAGQAGAVLTRITDLPAALGID